MLCYVSLMGKKQKLSIQTSYASSQDITILLSSQISVEIPKFGKSPDPHSLKRLQKYSSITMAFSTLRQRFARRENPSAMHALLFLHANGESRKSHKFY